MEQIRQLHETAMRLRDDAREAEQAYYREKMLQTACDLERHAADLEAMKAAFGPSIQGSTERPPLLLSGFQQH